MQIILIIVSVLCYPLNVFCQQYKIHIKIVDENTKPVFAATVTQLSTGKEFINKESEVVELLTAKPKDSFLIYKSGYLEKIVVASAGQQEKVCLQKVPPKQLNSRISGRKKLGAAADFSNSFSGETYADIVENTFTNTAENDIVELSLHIDKASYSNIRRFINNKIPVPQDAVRIDEMLNYFNFNTAKRPVDSTFNISTTVSNCPWNPAHSLLYISLCAKQIQLNLLPPSHLIFLIDVSASMDMPKRLPLIKSALGLLVQNLRNVDTVTIITYGGKTEMALPPTDGAEKDSILNIIDQLQCGGSTNGESGIKTAYQVAKEHFIINGNNRIILATDGDFNVGVQTETQLENLITEHAADGIMLSCIGVGMGNYKDSKIQSLSRKGNGNFYYLDNVEEAEKVFMTEFTQTLYSVANDAALKIKFEKESVAAFKLLGFENRKMALLDSNAIIKGGEIGSGYAMLGVVELQPGNRFSPQTEISIRYKRPNSNLELNETYLCHTDYTLFEKLNNSYRLAACVIQFGMYLKHPTQANKADWNRLLNQARIVVDKSDYKQNEFLELLYKSKKQYGRRK